MKRKVFLSVLALFLMATSAAALPKVETPLIATTCGQSPGAMMIKMSAMQAKVAPVDASKTLTADELDPEKCKTLIVTTGTSMKGMGAAGTDVDKEIARCTALMKAAKEKGILVIGAHIEGMARRTDASDEASIKAVMPLADALLVIADSDSDGFFTKYAQELGKELIVVKDALAIGAKLAELQ
ncbi:MAG: hypothetical protein IJR68_03280 [Fretibacterium sp.]|nr:hypothetical protein [Fretibacterium sp.]